jgi:hypothetical protein
MLSKFNCDSNQPLNLLDIFNGKFEPSCLLYFHCTTQNWAWFTNLIICLTPTVLSNLILAESETPHMKTLISFLLIYRITVAIYKHCVFHSH